MFRPYELFVGLRYLRAKRRNHFISFISMISMAGIAVGVMALITVLSVMNGFEKELRDRVLGMASHATVQGWDEPLADWQAVREAALEHPAVGRRQPLRRLLEFIDVHRQAAAVAVVAGFDAGAQGGAGTSVGTGGFR